MTGYRKLCAFNTDTSSETGTGTRWHWYSIIERVSKREFSMKYFVYYIVMRGFKTCLCNCKLTSIVVNSHPCHSTAVFTRGDTEYLEFSTNVNCVLVTIRVDCEPRAIHFRRNFNWKWRWNGCIGIIVNHKKHKWADGLHYIAKLTFTTSSVCICSKSTFTYHWFCALLNSHKAGLLQLCRSYSSIKLARWAGAYHTHTYHKHSKRAEMVAFTDNGV